MRTTATRHARLRILAVIQVALVLASLASPLATFAAITSVTPNNMNQGATGSVVIDSTANNFPNGNNPYAVSFSGTGVTATSVTWTNAHILTVTVTVDVSATPGLRIMTVSGAGGFVSQTAGFTVNAAKQNQTISFGALANKRPDQMPVTVSATASSGLSVTFSSATPAVCTVSGAIVSYVANGTCTVNADQAGNATYNPAPRVSQGFAIGPASQTITFGALADKTLLESPVTIGATASSGLAVSFSSNSTGVCTVSGTTVTLLSTGTCSISADQGGNANWNAAPTVTQTFQVTKASSTTTVTCPASVTYDGSAQTPCSAQATGAGMGPVALTVTYGANTNAGTATASASWAGDASHAGSSDATTFTIGPAPSTTTVTCPAGSFTFSGSAQTPCSAQVTSVGMSPIALTVTYDANTNAGTATASASWAGDANHAGSSDSATFTIDPAGSTTVVTCPAGPFTFSGSAQTPCSASVTGAGGLSLAPTPTYANNTNAGTATASFTFAGDANHTGSGDSATFAIGPAASTTVVTCPTSVTYDGSAQTPCTAEATGAGMSPVPLAVTHGANTSAGTATADAAWGGDANHTGSSGSATFEIAKAASTTVVTCPASVTYDGSAQTPCSATVTGAGGVSLTPTPVYTSNTNAGTASAAAGWEGDANHLASADTTTFEILKADAVISVVGYTGLYDGAAHGATGTVTGVLGEDLSGDLDLGASFTDVPGGTASWAFTDGTGNYNDDSGSVPIDIGKAAPVILVTGFDVPFDGLPHTALGSATGVLGEDLSADLDLGGTTRTEIGLYDDPWTFTDSTGNYLDDSGTVASSIGLAASVTTITFEPAPYTYRGTAFTATAQVTGANGLDTTTVVSYDGDCTHVTSTNGCTASASYAGDATHGPSTGSVSITIDPRTLNVTATADDKIYDGDTWAVAHLSDDRVAGDDVVLGYGSADFASANAGAGKTVTVTGISIDDGADADNYVPGNTSAAATASIDKADPDITVHGWAGTYTGHGHGASGSARGVNDEDLSDDLDLGASFTDVPGGTADWTFTDTTGNYNDASGSVDVEIDAAAQAIDFPALPDVTFGVASFQLAATTGSGLPITYASLTPTTCTVSGSTVTVVGIGTCTVEAMQAGDANHAPAEPVRQSFVVGAADGSTPETSTQAWFGGPLGGGDLSLPLLLGLAAAAALGILLLLLGFRARRRPSAGEDAF